METAALIIATGASPIRLGLPNEARLTGHGVSTCATCDGYFFRGKDLVVVGGGDSAIEEAIFLTKFARMVTVVHRRDKLRASKIMQDRAIKNEKISFAWNSIVEDIVGQDMVTGVRLKNIVTGTSTDLPCDGVFVAIGHRPNTDLFTGQLDLDEEGYVRTVARHRDQRLWRLCRRRRTRQAIPTSRNRRRFRLHGSHRRRAIS